LSWASRLAPAGRDRSPLTGDHGTARSTQDAPRRVNMNLVEGGSDMANDPTRSSYDRAYWLRRCEGFLVETPTKRIGRVTGMRFGETTNEPAVLEVRAGLFGRTRLLISVDDITEIDPEQGLLSLADPPRPL
jgi:hypothetical protein